jgi:hypothetical protein
VPYGESVSRNGRTIWAGYDGEQLVCVATTAEEVRVKYREIRKAREREEQTAKADKDGGKVKNVWYCLLEDLRQSFFSPIKQFPISRHRGLPQFTRGQ